MDDFFEQSDKLIFGKYSIVRRLAIGGMAEIFLARQTDSFGVDRLVILKSLLPDLAQYPNFVEQFMAEARMAATLNHTNIVYIYEVGAWEGTYFIAMEYIKGENLSRLLRAAIEVGIILPQGHAVRIIYGAAQALAHAHDATDINGTALNIVHRDISPQNIMLRSDGVTKVVDFGIARASNEASRTATGQIKGKLSYMPPEQLRGEAVDHRADQFSLGVVLWELVTCQRVVKPGSTHLQILEQVTNHPIQSPKEVNPEISDKLAEVVCKMAERLPENRYSSWQEVLTALKAVLKEDPDEIEEIDVGVLINDLLGESMADQVKDLTPTPDNFVLSLNSAEATLQKTVVQGTGAPLEEESGFSKKKRNLFAALGVGAVGLAIFMTFFGPFSSPPPAETSAESMEPSNIFITSPEGAVVTLNGAEQKEAVPTVLSQLEPGDYTVLLTLKGHHPLEKTFALAGGTTATLSETMRLKEGTLKILSSPSGASIYNGNQELGKTGADLPLTLPAEVPHTLHLRRAGYQSKKITVTLKTDTLTEWPLETLVRAKKVPKSAATATAVPLEDGTLTLQTTPWSQVKIDGESRGVTPLFKVRLKPGKHQLQLVNEALNINVKRSILIKPGKNLKHNWDLTSP